MRSNHLLTRRDLLDRESLLINIHVNGESREVPADLTLAALLEWLKLPADRLAVECNLEIVPRSKWGDLVVQANDRLEVVHFVGGGKNDFTRF